MMWGCQGTYLFHSKILDLDHDVGLQNRAKRAATWNPEDQAGSYIAEQEQVLESVGIWSASRGDERRLPFWDSLLYTGSVAAGFISAKLAH